MDRKEQQGIRRHLRTRLLQQAHVTEVGNLADMRRSEWSPRFETLMRNRLLFGAFRYGKLGGEDKDYDRIVAALDRLQEYQRTGNDELLVDVANIMLLEFVGGHAPPQALALGGKKLACRA